MNTAPLATVASQTLADAVEERLAGALAGHEEVCLWCGAGPIAVTVADIWSGAVTVRCPQCGSELSGVVPRHLREVRR
jgi:hypothetical protein